MMFHTASCNPDFEHLQNFGDFSEMYALLSVDADHATDVRAHIICGLTILYVQATRYLVTVTVQHEARCRRAGFGCVERPQRILGPERIASMDFSCSRRRRHKEFMKLACPVAWADVVVR